MNVSACLVTRGNVDMQPVLDSLPEAWEKIVWDNSRGWHRSPGPPRRVEGGVVRDAILVEQAPDVAVYGRYAAIEYASHDLIYVQDDDCIVSNPQAIVDTWLRGANFSAEASPAAQVGAAATWPRGVYPRGKDVVVCNMPQEFRQFYTGADALVGFGACFHRDAPKRAFSRFRDFRKTQYDDHPSAEGVRVSVMNDEWRDLSGFVERQPFFQRTCDIVFTGLAPTVLVDVEKFDRDFATADDRMYRQPEHVAERQRMRDLVAKVRNA